MRRRQVYEYFYLLAGQSPALWPDPVSPAQSAFTHVARGRPNAGNMVASKCPTLLNTGGRPGTLPNWLVGGGGNLKTYRGHHRQISKMASAWSYGIVHGKRWNYGKCGVSPVPLDRIFTYEDQYGFSENGLFRSEAKWQGRTWSTFRKGDMHKLCYEWLRSW